MARQRLLACAAVVVAGCSEPPPAPLAAPPPSPSPSPAPVTPPPRGVTELPTYDPSAGHLDHSPAPAPATRPRNRAARSIGLLLRSTPAGALASLDGQPIGRTPTYWEGEVTGGEREVTFTLPGYSVARYRFVPITSGVVHGRLELLEGVLVPPLAPAPVGTPAPHTAPTSDPAPVPVAPVPDAAPPLPDAPSAPDAAPVANEPPPPSDASPLLPDAR